MKMSLGADPEMFLKIGNDFHSAHGVIPGTKAAPHKVKQGAVQVDGMAVEFNIDPAESEDKFVSNIQTVMGELRNMVPARFTIDISPVANFDEFHMEKQPEEAKLLGCDPDYNAYTLAANPRPNQHPTMRTAAGHVHIGWTSGEDPTDLDHIVTCATLVKQLDWWLGLPSLLLDPDTERRKMYGMAGAFRPKPYGLEYRVLSNFWLKDENLMRWVYRNTAEAFKRLAIDGKRYDRGEAAAIIGLPDQEDAKLLAKEWLHYYDIPSSI